MEILDDMPLGGQFVMVWKFEGSIWSETLKWEDGRLWRYLESIDEWDVYAKGNDLIQDIKFVVNA